MRALLPSRQNLRGQLRGAALPLPDAWQRAGLRAAGYTGAFLFLRKTEADLPFMKNELGSQIAAAARISRLSLYSHPTAAVALHKIMFRASTMRLQRA